MQDRLYSPSPLLRLLNLCVVVGVGFARTTDLCAQYPEDLQLVDEPGIFRLGLAPLNQFDDGRLALPGQHGGIDFVESLRTQSIDDRPHQIA